jgi:hypothetical protein
MQPPTPSTTELTYEQMPLWMRRSQQRFDWGIVFALLIGLLAAWPFFSHSQLSMTTGQLQAAFRTADTAAMLREGWLYPRWSPHVLGGYGAPIPNYVPPGAPYFAAVIEVLFTDDTLTALRITYIFALIAVSVGVYLLVTRWSNCIQGLMATALYTLSPVVGLSIPHLEGNLALLISAALLPLTLWTFDRLLHDESALELLYVVCLVAMQLFVEPCIGLVTGLWCTFLLFITQRQCRLSVKILARAFAAWIAGISLTCMFWLPALGETSLVTWRSQPLAPSEFPITLGQFLQPMHAIDPIQLKPGAHYTLGIPLLTASAFALIVLIIRPKQLTTVFRAGIAITLLLTVVLVLFLPTAHWLMLPITLGATITGSIGIKVFDLFPNTSALQIVRRIAPPLLIGVLLVTAHPIWLAPASHLPISGVTPADQVRYEQLTGRSPLLASNAQLPSTLPAGIDTNPLLTNSYAFTSARSFDTLSKIVPPQLTRNGQLNIVWQHSHESLFQIPEDRNRIRQTPPANTQLLPSQLNGGTAAPAFTWLTPYFPGWQASLDGEPISLSTEPTTNLIRVELPTGASGALLLRLDSTSTRAISWGVSGVSLVIVLILTRLILRSDNPEDRISPLRYMQGAETRLFAVLAVCFVFLFAYLNLAPTGHLLRATPGEGLQAATPIRVQTSVGLQLFGYQIEAPEAAKPGDTVQFDLYWRVLRSVPDNYWVRLSLTPLSAESTTVPIILAEQMPGDLPTRLWPTERYIQDRYAATLPDDLPEGNYLPGLEVFVCSISACNTSAPGGQVALFAENSRTAINRLDLPELIEVRR